MNTSEKLNLAEIRDIAIESGLQLIPGVGGVLATVYFGTKQAKEFKRLENFYMQLSEDLSKKDTKIASIESQFEDGLISLIEQVNDKVEKEHQDDKLKCYKQYMKSILTKPVSPMNYDSRKVFLDILSSMSLLEIEIISYMYKNNHIGYITVKNMSKNGVHQYAIVGAISKLKSYGLVSTQQGSFTVGGGMDNLLEEQIHINDYGVDFVKFSIE